MAVADIVQILKDAGEDFEWYPTTSEMIRAIGRRCGSPDSVLDVGAGDGRVLVQIAELCKAGGRCEPSLYAIEKAAAHLQAMPADVAIVGTDFYEQSLLDKQMDMVFCNPPYSDFETWASKVIREGNAKSIFLILPARWKSSEAIQAALAMRGNPNLSVIWEGDFTNADRQARARVEIIEIRPRDGEDHRRSCDPFGVWFDSVFPEFDKIEEPLEAVENKPKVLRDVLPGQNLVERLAELYAADMQRLHENYRGLCSMDVSLLKELGVTKAAVASGLRQKIQGCKDLYWKELFDGLDSVYERLTSKSRAAILGKMRECGQVDFTVGNAYAVVLWVVKQANGYINGQICDLFRKLSEPEAVKNYKSNQRVWQKSGWRYAATDHSHYILDYRIVASHYQAVKPTAKPGEYVRDWEFPCGLHESAHDLIGDVLTVANNLGFTNHETSTGRVWESNQQEDFYTAHRVRLLSVRAFKNGNIHFKFNQDFMRALNVEAGRLLGWVNTPEEAAREMDIPLTFTRNRFASTRTFKLEDHQRLLA